MNWFLTIREHPRRNRGRERETALVATLCHYLGGEHSLRGEHGLRILKAACDRWNRERRESPPPTTCAADRLTEAARTNFHLKLTHET